MFQFQVGHSIVLDRRGVGGVGVNHSKQKK